MLLNVGLTCSSTTRDSPGGEDGAVQMAIFKRSAGLTFIAVLSVAVAACQQPAPPLPPLPPLTQSCTYTNTPEVVVPADRGVTDISVGRRGIEPSLVFIGVRIGDEVRQDGAMYVPGPDLSYRPYFINHPRYFARTRESNEPKHLTASMLWSSAGALYDRAPAFSILCLDIDGATVAFYTARTLQPNTLVRFNFSPPTRPRRAPRQEPAPQEPTIQGAAPSTQ